MLKIMKYLKPYTLYLILAILLLYVQAVMNLTLPDYMSKIVNIGIQQSGIEDTLPKAVSGLTMKRLLLFMDNSEKNLF
ncbi:hypothetical protein [Marinitoga lauensis]|uniref:hypothetical protein n=1 Tax=Marinitoga lauensis TaxID=2201189 RepID=UPI001010255D|nr:hypothetical protein [Marinitoga lauensis]